MLKQKIYEYELANGELSEQAEKILKKFDYAAYLYFSHWEYEADDPSTGYRGGYYVADAKVKVFDSAGLQVVIDITEDDVEDWDTINEWFTELKENER